MPAKPDAIYGCVEWDGKSDGGYPLAKGGASKWEHRRAWEEVNGPLGALQLDHWCRNTMCVRLEHLEAVTQAENIRRKYWSHRSQLRKCPKGHDLFENGRRTPNGGIICRRCCGI